MKTNQMEPGVQSEEEGQRAVSVVVSNPSSLFLSVSHHHHLWLLHSLHHSTCFPHHLFVAVPLGAERALCCSTAR